MRECLHSQLNWLHNVSFNHRGEDPDVESTLNSDIVPQVMKLLWLLNEDMGQSAQHRLESDAIFRAHGFTNRWPSKIIFSLREAFLLSKSECSFQKKKKWFILCKVIAKANQDKYCLSTVLIFFSFSVYQNSPRSSYLSLQSHHLLSWPIRSNYWNICQCWWCEFLKAEPG